MSKIPMFNDEDMDAFIKNSKVEVVKKKDEEPSIQVTEYPSNQVTKYSSIQVIKYSDYADYARKPVFKGRNGNKVQSNFSISVETAQKVETIQANEYVGSKGYSKIADVAIGLLYDACYLLDNRDTRIIDMDPIEILKLLGVDTTKIEGGLTNE